MRVAWRVLAGLYWVCAGLAICALAFPWWPPQRRMRVVGWWARHMLAALGVELRMHGGEESSAQGVLLVANHVSWLDILAIDAVSSACFVAKSEVRAWPVVGWLAASAGTLFLERRRRRDALRMGETMATALSAGATVALFPEGTVGDGTRLLPFHANLLQAAITTGKPVRPVALKYTDAESGAGGDPRARPTSAAVAYHGHINLVQSIRKVLAARGLAVDVYQGAELEGFSDRRMLAECARSAIRHMLAGQDQGAAGEAEKPSAQPGRQMHPHHRRWNAPVK